MKAWELMKTVCKDHGDSIVSMAGDLPDCERVPTGIFPFDLASGGGFPRGSISIITGPESSGKTNLALATIANEHRAHPEMTNVLIDIERAFDPKWAVKLGINLDKLMVVRPSYGEQASDLIQQFLSAGDVSIVVVDSVAGMVPEKEIEGSSERAQVGGNSVLVQKMIHKAMSAIGRATAEDRFPTLLLINQIRYKVGVMWGDPETMPGGKAMFHHVDMIIRMYGKNVMDKEVNAQMPVRKLTTLVIKKHRRPVCAINAEYEMVMVAHKGMKPGQVGYWKTMEKYMRDLGWLTKEKNGWKLADSPVMKTLGEVKKFLEDDHELLAAMQQKLIETELP